MIPEPFQILILDKKGGAKTHESQEVENILVDDGALPWIHLDYSQPEAINWLEKAEFIDTIVKNNLQDEDSRPRSIKINDGLFLSLRGVNLNKNADPEDMVGIRLWATDSLIISSSRRALASIEELNNQLFSKTGPKSTASFILSLIHELAVRTEEVVEEIEGELEGLEDNLSESEQAKQRINLSELRRQSIRLKRFLAPQKEALLHLINDAPVWIKKKEKNYLKEYLNKYNRYLEELDSIRERAIIAQEELIAKLSETLNQRMYMLSLVATLFLPLGFFTGLLGINVGGIPLAEDPKGFATICIGLVIVVLCLIVIMRRNKWF